MVQGVICVGYTDLPSRLPTQSSTLYSNNLSKFLLSMGPFTGHKEHFFIDHKDDAVRGALILDQGEMMWPAPPLKVCSSCLSATQVLSGQQVSIMALPCPALPCPALPCPALPRPAKAHSVFHQTACRCCQA